jgi:hypothetical protein
MALIISPYWTGQVRHDVTDDHAHGYSPDKIMAMYLR